LQVYPFEAAAPDILRIRSVRDGTRDLSRIDFRRLKMISTHWFGRSAPRFQTYATVGRHLLIVHPYQPSSSSVNVVYTQQLPAFGSEADVVGLRDDQVPILVKLVEALILLKQRDLDRLAPLMQNITNELQAVKGAQGMAA
jgi:hypothetical protein